LIGGGVKKAFSILKVSPPEKRKYKKKVPMIISVIGIPGSGKSFWAVKTTLEYISSGGVVFSNIRLKGAQKISDEGIFRYGLEPSSPAITYLKKFMKWDYQEGQYSFIDLDQYDSSFLSLIPYGSKEKRILLILDEVNEWFDSLDRGKLTKDEKYRELFKFLRLSRHYHIDVVFLLQDFNTLNPRLRGLCAKIIEATDMQKMKIAGFPIPFPFPWFLWKEYDNKGKNVLRSETWVKDQNIFDCYDSFCEVGSVGLSGQLVKTDFVNGDSTKKGKKKMSMFERCIFYLVLGFMGFYLWRFSGDMQKMKMDIQKKNVVSVSAVSSNSVDVSRIAPVGSGVRSVASGASVPSKSFVYVCDYQYGQFANGRSVLKINGIEMHEGQEYEWGKLMYYSDYVAQFLNNDGISVYVYAQR